MKLAVKAGRAGRVSRRAGTRRRKVAQALADKVLDQLKFEGTEWIPPWLSNLVDAFKNYETVERADFQKIKENLHIPARALHRAPA